MVAKASRGMVRAAVMDCGLSGEVDVWDERPIHELFRELSALGCELVLVHSSSSVTKALRAGALLHGRLKAPFVQVEALEGCSEGLIVTWGSSSKVASTLRRELNLRELEPSYDLGEECSYVEGGKAYVKVRTADVGDYVLVNGYVIGVALNSHVDLVIDLVNRRVESAVGINLLEHGVDKLLRMGPFNDVEVSTLKKLRVEPKFSSERGPGPSLVRRVVYVDNAKYGFSKLRGADAVIAVGDDTTAITGYLASKLSLPTIGIVDGDAEHLMPCADSSEQLLDFMAEGSAVVVVAEGLDDEAGSRVLTNLLKGRHRRAFKEPLSTAELTRLTLKAFEGDVPIKRISIKGLCAP